MTWAEKLVIILGNALLIAAGMALLALIANLWILWQVTH